MKGTAVIVSPVLYQDQGATHIIQSGEVSTALEKLAEEAEAEVAVKEDNTNITNDMESQSGTIQTRPNIPLAEISYNKHVIRFIQKQDNVEFSIPRQIRLANQKTWMV